MLKRLTFDAGLQTDVTFSPDGRFIAYASDRSGNFDIWVQPVDGGDAVQITKEPAQDVQPAWSPDGDSIAFRSERSGGGIFVMPALGGHARQLSTFGSHPSWLSRSEILFLIGNPEGAGIPGQLFVVPVNGDAPREVLQDFLLGGGLFWAAGHPDGRISVFADHPTLGFGLFTLTRDGKSVTASHIPASLPIRRRASMDTTPTRFHWNRSGTALYLEATVDGIQNLWRVAVDPRSLEWLTMERLTTGPGRDVAASLAGRRQAAGVHDHQRADAGVRPIAVGRRQDADRLTRGRDRGRCGGVRIRPFQRRAPPRLHSPACGQRAIRAPNRAGGHRGEHTTRRGRRRSGGIAWSHDGSAILHQRVRTGREAQMVRHEPGGRETVVLPWSKTAFLGEPISAHEMLGSLFHFSGPPSEIAIWSIAGDASSKQRRILLSDAKANLWQASYVPGGRWISFVREPLGEAQRLDLMIAPAEGSPPTGWIRLVPDHPWADKPQWSADGRLMYFLSRGSGDYFNLWALPFDPIRGVAAGRAFAITSYDSPARFVSPHAGRISMDVVKGRVALTMSSTTGSIWMLDDVEAGEPRTGSR